MKKILLLLIAILIIMAGLFYLFNNKIPLNQYFETVGGVAENIRNTKSFGLISWGTIKAKVTKVVDGDTFSVLYNKKNYKVRMLYIDTPESVKKNVPTQSYSKEAYNVTRKHIIGKNIFLSGE